MPTRSNTFKKSEAQQVRFASPTSSEATYGGSEAGDVWDDIYDEVDTKEDRYDREEIATWLLCSDPQPWTSPHIEDTMEVPFTLSLVPGPLFLQLFQALLVFFHILPKRKLYPMTIPHHAPTRYPEAPPKVGGRISEWYNHAGKEVTLSPFTPPHDEDDDTRYIISPRIGSNQDPLSIIVTSNWSWEKLKTHPRGTLRIYRVPSDDVVEFNTDASKLQLLGAIIRRPDDEFDCISVLRHGYRSWDLGGKDEWWKLMSTDTVLLREVLTQIERRNVSPYRHLFNTLRKRIIWPLLRYLWV